MFTGKKPEVNHLRIFGCRVYIHVPKVKRTKLEPSGNEGIFVGYSETSKAYRIHIPGLKKIEVSPDVIFDEGATYKKSKQRRAGEDLDEEPVAPRVTETVTQDVDMLEGYTSEDHDMTEP